jgi:hypothetical protein
MRISKGFGRCFLGDFENPHGVIGLANYVESATVIPQDNWAKDSRKFEDKG